MTDPASVVAKLLESDEEVASDLARYIASMPDTPPDGTVELLGFWRQHPDLLTDLDVTELDPVEQTEVTLHDERGNHIESFTFATPDDRQTAVDYCLGYLNSQGGPVAEAMPPFTVDEPVCTCDVEHRLADSVCPICKARGRVHWNDPA